MDPKDIPTIHVKLPGDEIVPPEGGPCKDCPYSSSLDLSELGVGMRWACFHPVIVHAIKMVGLPDMPDDQNQPADWRGVYRGKDMALVSFAPEAAGIPAGQAWPMAFLPHLMVHCVPYLADHELDVPVDVPYKSTQEFYDTIRDLGIGQESSGTLM